MLQCIFTYFLLGLKYGFGWFYLITILVALNASSSAFLFGSFFSNSQIANAFFMLIVQPQLNFTGMWASIYYIPLAARWLIYVLYMYYATAITILLMFRDCIKDGSKGCIEILRQDHVNPKYEGLYWLGFLGILIFTRLLGFAVFTIRAQKFS
jgi:ABC-type multidrug transport system permease subunit